MEVGTIKILWWYILIICYFGLSFMLCVFATGEMLCDWIHQKEFKPNEDDRWWHVPRLYAFVFFCGPVYVTYMVIKMLLEKNRPFSNTKQRRA